MKGWIELMESSYELFQQVAADYLHCRKQERKTENWEETIGKDSFCFTYGKSKKTTLIRLETFLTNALQKQVNETICVIYFQNSQKETVYWVLYKKSDSYSALSFVDKGNGVVINKTGKINEKMRFDSYGVEKDDFSISLTHSFKEVLKEHGSFRLLSVTGLLCFKDK